MKDGADAADAFREWAADKNVLAKKSAQQS
jgi:hypothetical protein